MLCLRIITIICVSGSIKATSLYFKIFHQKSELNLTALKITEYCIYIGMLMLKFMPVYLPVYIDFILVFYKFQLCLQLSDVVRQITSSHCQCSVKKSEIVQ